MRITEVRVRKAHTLEVTFEDGSSHIVDVSPQLFGPVFEALRDPAGFAQVTVDDGLSVVWPNGADLAPEYLRAAPVSA